jgi:hypothetical protein
LHVGGRCNLNTVRVVQSTEYAHEQQYARRPGRTGGSCGRCYNSVGSCFPIRDAGRVAGNAGAINKPLALGSVDAGTTERRWIRDRRCREAQGSGALRADGADSARRLADGGSVLALSQAKEVRRIRDPRDSFVPMILPACSRREQFRAGPLRWRRCRSFSFSSSPRTRAWRPHDRDRSLRPAAPAG